MYCLSFVNMQHIISTESAFYSAISSDQEAILEISGHIDLNNLLIYQISDRSTLLFNGGSLSNGKLDVHGTRVINLGNAFCFKNVTLTEGSFFSGGIQDSFVLKTKIVEDVEIVDDVETLAFCLAFQAITLSRDYHLDSEILIYHGFELDGNNHLITLYSASGNNPAPPTCFSVRNTYEQRKNFSLKNTRFRDDSSIEQRPDNYAIFNLLAGNSLYMENCILETTSLCLSVYGLEDYEKGDYIVIRDSILRGNRFCWENGAKRNEIYNSTVEIYSSGFYAGDVISNVGNMLISGCRINGGIEIGQGPDGEIYEVVCTDSDLSEMFSVGSRDVVSYEAAKVFISHCRFSKVVLPPYRQDCGNYDHLWMNLSTVSISDCLFMLDLPNHDDCQFLFKNCRRIILKDNVFIRQSSSSASPYWFLIIQFEDSSPGAVSPLESIIFDNNIIDLGQLFCWLITTYESSDYSKFLCRKTNYLQNTNAVCAHNSSTGLVIDNSLISTLF